MGISIGIIEDNLTFRKNIEDFIRDLPGFKFEFGSDDVESVLKNALDYHPEIILLDIELPGISGLEGLRLLKQSFKKTDIIILSSHEDSEYIFKAMCNGAAAYLSKRSTLIKIKECIETVYHGGSYMSPTIARKVFDHFQGVKKKTTPLSPRQMQVVEGLVDGKSYKMIADHLTIKVETVRGYIKEIYQKLNVHSKSEVISKYYKGEI